MRKVDVSCRLPRMKRYASRLALAAVLGGVLCESATAAPLSCGDLKGLRLTDGEILSADSVEAGRFNPPAGVTLTPEAMKATPAFCRVRAKLAPSSDSDIRIEVWLPTAAWNGKFRVLGNGGLAGVVPYAGMAAALGRGTPPPAPTPDTSETTPTSCVAILKNCGISVIAPSTS